jgi:ABC-type Fe3+ transport system permease subunit
MRAIVLLLCFLPLLALSVLAGGDPWLEGRQLAILWRSVWISALAAAFALVAGSLAVSAARRHPFLEALSIVPLFLPPIVITMGWVFFAGNWWNLYTPLGAAFVLSMCYFPVVTILGMMAHRSIDPAWEAAARLWADPWRVFWHFRRPLLQPYYVTAALIVFLLSFADYSVSSALRVNVYPFEIFTEFNTSYATPRAVMLCLPPVLIAVALGLLIQPRFVPTIGTPRRFAANRAAWPGVAVLVVALGVPLASLVGTMPDFAEAHVAVRDNVKHSIVLSTFGSLLVLLGAVIMAMRPLDRVTRSLLILPLVLPGSAIGLGIIVLKMHTWGAAAMAYALYCKTLTVPALLVAASASAIRPRVYEAAMGVPASRQLVGITLPLLAPGLISALVTAFVFCLGELSATAIVNAAGWETLTMRIESLLHFGEHGKIAAICLTLALISGAVLTVASVVLRRRFQWIPLR